MNLKLIHLSKNWLSYRLNQAEFRNRIDLFHCTYTMVQDMVFGDQYKKPKTEIMPGGNKYLLLYNCD